MSDDIDIEVGDLAGKFNIPKLMQRAKARRDGEADGEPAESGEAGPDGVVSLERLKPLPRPGDAYKAFAMPSNQSLPTLFFLMADGSVWGYPYSSRVEGPHLAYASDPGKGMVIVLRFAGIIATEAVLSGRRLENLHNLLGYHRVAWVRELPKGKLAADGDGPVVTRIVIRPVESRTAQMEDPDQQDFGL